MNDLIANLENNLLATDPGNWGSRALIIRSCIDSGFDADARRLIESAPSIPEEEEALLLAAEAWRKDSPQIALGFAERVLALNSRSKEGFSLRVDLLEAIESSPVDVASEVSEMSEVEPMDPLPENQPVEAPQEVVSQEPLVEEIVLPSLSPSVSGLEEAEDYFYPQPGEFPTRTAAEAVADVIVSPLVPPESIPDPAPLSYVQLEEQVPVHYTEEDELSLTRRNVMVVPQLESEAILYDYQQPNEELFEQQTGLDEIYVAAAQSDTGLPIAPPAVSAKAHDKENEKRRAATIRRDKMKSIIATIVAHVVIFFLIGLIVIASPRVLPPEIVASVGPINDEVKVEKKQIVQQTPKPPAASAMPTPDLLSSAATSPFVAPTVDFEVADTEVELGTSFNSGMSFGSGASAGGAPGAMTMFGRSGGGSGLEGTFYDMKQNAKGDPNPSFNMGVYIPLIEEFGDSKFSRKVVSDLFKADKKISYTSLLIPQLDALEGPKAFEVEDKVEPKFWFVHYTGKVQAPKAGKWRFAGGFDNILYVYVDNELVFEGSFRHPKAAPRPDSEVTQSFTKPGFCIGTPVLYGKWVELNEPFKLDIIIGESAGGLMGGGVLIQQEGANYDEDPDGTPILPLLAIGESVPRSIKDRAAVYPGTEAEPSFAPYPFAERGPVFKMVTGAGTPSF